MVIAVVCEGQTEETFIKRLLAPHLSSPKKVLKPFLLNGLPRRGYPKLAHEIRQHLRERGIRYVTTFIDLYALPQNFPGKQEAPSEPYAKVQYLEEAFAKDIGDERFIPYLMLHEFEALLFAPSALREIQIRARLSANNSAWKRLREDLKKVDTPERLNDGENSHPSARLRKIWPNYRKTADGIAILEAVSIPTLLEACPHFRSWVEKLIKLPSV